MHGDLDDSNPPGRRLGAVVVVMNPDDNVLLVKPTYKDGWQLPGGGAQPGENIGRAAERELQEETGLVRRITHFVALDQVPANPGAGVAEGINVVCDGGTLTAEEAAAVAVPAGAAGELSEVRWVPRAEIGKYALPYQSRRIYAALDAIDRDKELPLLELGELVGR